MAAARPLHGSGSGMASAPACTVCVLHAESTFRIEGMDCREEVALIERRFKHLPGLEDFSADIIGRRLHVKYDAAKLSTASIAAAVADAGMRAWLEHEEPVAMSDDETRRRHGLLIASGGLLAAGMLAGWSPLPAWTASAFFAGSTFLGVPLTIPKAWRAVRIGSLDINVLMLIAASGAIALGQWSEAAAVVFLFAVAQALETRTLERARTAVHALMDLTPTQAWVREGSGSRAVDVEVVTPGSIVLVKPGEKVPLDGEVVSGTSAVNQAPVTGESLPIDKGPGDEVFAGTINGGGALDVRVTRLRRDATLARIIHLVEQAQATRAPAQTFVERFARIYTPAVIALALVLAFVPPLAAGAPWSTWIYRALVLLVVSCPCALVISTPVSIVAALAGAARKGVLIKGGAHLERAGRVRCVAFDKTGTLTRGVPEVVDVLTLDGGDSAALMAAAAAVEKRSSHPIADAIVRHAEGSHLVIPEGSDVAEIAGQGAEGSVNGDAIVIGNHRLFEERRLCSPEVHSALDDLAARGQTAVLVARNGDPVGVIGVADRPRESSRDVIDLLRRQGIASLVMLTGDSQAPARAVGSELGVDEVRAELLPADKVAAVRELQRKFGSVAMVGDGVNDAPALASADVGIVMGAAGSAAAIETADVALMANELLKIPYALRLSRATLRNIQANLAISLVLKAAFVVAAVFGVATLWMAILADTGASVIVIANALRLLRAD
jgi:Cd2+/Zn2+-exporting ATPase